MIHIQIGCKYYFEKGIYYFKFNFIENTNAFLCFLKKTYQNVMPRVLPDSIRKSRWCWRKKYILYKWHFLFSGLNKVTARQVLCASSRPWKAVIWSSSIKSDLNVSNIVGAVRVDAFLLRPKKSEILDQFRLSGAIFWVKSCGSNQE